MIHVQTIYVKLIAKRSEIYNFLKWLSIPLVMIALYYQIFVQADILQVWSVFTQNLFSNSSFYLLLCLLLVPINLGAEAVKWKKLVSFLNPISFRKAFYSVLAGISVSIFTPKRIGEYGGRVILLPENRLQAVSSLFVSNLSQSIANLILGMISLTLFISRFTLNAKHPELFFVIALIMVIVLLYIYFHLNWLVCQLSRWSFFKKNLETIDVVKRYDHQTLFKILSLSFMKYFIFILQFVLIIKALGTSVELGWGIICASCVFFIKTILPVPASVELAARGSIAIYFFSHFTENHIGILVASILLWIINLAVPALFGSVLIAKTKI